MCYVKQPHRQSHHRVDINVSHKPKERNLSPSLLLIVSIYLHTECAPLAKTQEKTLTGAYTLCLDSEE